jgi:uncharacterized protein DUF6812
MATLIERRPVVLTHTPERSRRATVRVETDGAVYVGRICLPDAKYRVSDVLADDRQFLSLTEVRVNDGDQVEAYMAVNKSFIRTLRVLDEAAPVAASRGLRSEAC